MSLVSFVKRAKTCKNHFNSVSDGGGANMILIIIII